MSYQGKGQISTLLIFLRQENEILSIAAEHTILQTDRYLVVLAAHTILTRLLQKDFEAWLW